MKGNGGGAGHATTGKEGGLADKHGDGGGTYGYPQLDRIFMGSGGGMASDEHDINQPGGGWGGGIIMIAAQTIDFQGTLSAKGQDKPTTPESGYYGGAGSGGSIRVEGNTVSLDTATVEGCSASDTYGAGRQGRVAVYYEAENGFSGNFTPGYLQRAGYR